MVYGHTTGKDSVELYSYSEFDAIDREDKYRLVDISARGSNRDGAALRFVAERLSHRPEELKLLILVSDGQPADTGYYGTAAEEDLRGIQQEYRRKGILFRGRCHWGRQRKHGTHLRGFLPGHHRPKPAARKADPGGQALPAGIIYTLPTLGNHNHVDRWAARVRRPFCLFLERMATMHFLTLTAVQISDMEVNLLPGLGRFFGQLPGLSPEDVLVVVDCHI